MWAATLWPGETVDGAWISKTFRRFAPKTMHHAPSRMATTAADFFIGPFLL